MPSKIEFAPLFVPLERRFQTGAVLLNTLVILSPVALLFFSIGLLLSPLAVPYLAYLAYILIYDRGVSSRGGRRSSWLRSATLWTYYRDYFPISLVKTADLPPERNYIIAYHPHGIIGCGAHANFATEATGWSRLFPGVRPHLCTLRSNFRLPLLREWILALGYCDVSRESICHIVDPARTGNAAVIVVGGAEESLYARPGNFQLTLLHRKGFVREALRNGACLVPCFSFGENDLFLQAAGGHVNKDAVGGEHWALSKVRRAQDWVKRMTGVAPVIFHGRGVFNYSFGLLPFRRAVHTVVGAPIQVPAVRVRDEADKGLGPAPNPAVVDALHQKYLEELEKLFEAHKRNYGVSADTKLTFV